MTFDWIDSSPSIGEKVYVKRLKSGLQVFILPKKHFAKKYVYFGTRFGGLYQNVVNGNNVTETLPLGIAHFLEHQIFEDVAESTFEKFEKLGASVNAYTSYGTTVYHFETVDHLEACMGLLMDLVQNTHITAETVEKEKDVIEQEIRMYMDDADWIIGSNLFRLMYHNHPIREDIAGTIEAVRATQMDQLLACYENFYAPENMSLFVYGDVDPELIVKQIEGLQTEAYVSRRLSHKLFLPEEPYAIQSSAVQAEMPVGKNRLLMGFKAMPIQQEENREFLVAALRVANDLMFGTSSAFYETVYSSGLISAPFDYDVQIGSGYAYVMVGNESDDLEMLCKIIVENIEYFIVHGFEQEDYERITKKIVGRWIASFNALQSIANNYTYNQLRGGSLFRQIEAYNTLTLNDVNQSLKRFYDLNNLSVSTVKNPT